MRRELAIALALSSSHVHAFGSSLIRPSAGEIFLRSGATSAPLAALRALSPLGCLSSPADDDRLAVWRHVHAAVHQAVQRTVVMMRSIAQRVALLLLTLMICLPVSPSYALALPAMDPPAVSAPAPPQPRYYTQTSPNSPLTDTAMPSLALRLPSLDGTALGRRKTSFVTAAVQAVGPAVVRIDTERLVDRPALEGYLVPGPPDSQHKEAGQGSGVILSEDGARMPPVFP
jgi:hypothetical protein